MKIFRLGIYLFDRTPLMDFIYDEKNNYRFDGILATDIAEFRFAN